MRLRAIGHLETPFATIADCPRNGRQLDPAPECLAVVDPAFQPGLRSIEGFSHLILLYWLGPQREALTITPPFDRTVRGVFATRAPLRPNPIGLSVVAFDGMAGPGRLRIRYLDCRTGTKLLDIKPYLPSTDAEPAAGMGWLTRHRTARPA
ncbi:MAG: tRNA (N6-threonylcarbamoyladenosine(37)-N6)-methyltransferase TrmO [Acetobacteraceae bacterium]|nr:tRNA (N6-threonylcarbamoyladenosine(37)-N6)-methyltransferase TrmO [Acetobacteraceae bacterium]